MATGTGAKAEAGAVPSVGLVGHHHQGGGAVGHDGGHPGLGVGDGQGDEDGADPQRGQGGHHEVDRVGQVEGHPVALGHPARRQAVGHRRPPPRTGAA